MGLIEIDIVKKEIRRRIREAIATVDRVAESAAIVTRIETLLPAEGLILGFTPLPDEPDISPILDRLKAQDRLVMIEPRPDARLDPPDRSISMALVPGRAFGRAGVRLGRGGGAYDRILAEIAAPKIGIAYACQLIDAIPRETHDVVMDAIVTSREIIWVPDSCMGRWDAGAGVE